MIDPACYEYGHNLVALCIIPDLRLGQSNNSISKRSLKPELIAFE